jgi:serine phosphatase RsbU (regulator of sigma subunit)
MIEPKTFYRNFDDLLERIQQQKPQKDFICSILSEAQSRFGKSLHLGTLRIYEERGRDYVLVRVFGENNASRPTQKLAADSAAVQEVLTCGSYIYDDPEMSIDPEISQHEHYSIPAAFVLQSPEKRWIGIFELYDGWQREEVLFALNAIRTALNFRMFAENITSELHQAAQIQRSLLPQEIPQLPGYEIAARSQPTEIVGGDLYDIFDFGDDIFGVCVGDASGHGIPAALLVRDIVIGLRMGLEKQMKMVHTLQKLNHVIYRSTYSSRFVSLFYGEIERDGHLIFVNAGHPAPFLIKGKNVVDLKATGLILGAIPDITLHRSYAHMQPDSVLVMYSDGIFERENQDEETFSIARLKQLVSKHQKKSAQKILDLIFEEVYEFGNRRKWEDDSTVMVVKRIAE